MLTKRYRATLRSITHRFLDLYHFVEIISEHLIMVESLCGSNTSPRIEIYVEWNELRRASVSRAPDEHGARGVVGRSYERIIEVSCLRNVFIADVLLFNRCVILSWF